MREEIKFDYHYEEEAERYSFIKIPKALYTEPMFRGISDGAKALYGLLLELMSLSRKNGWLDEQGRVYIRCSIEKVKEMLNCSNDKAVKMLMELDITTGIGLIEKVRQGQGKATIIYIKSFVISKDRSASNPIENKGGEEEFLNSEKQNTRIPEKQNTSIPKNRIQEFRKAEFKDSEKQNSRIPENRILEFQESECNNTYLNQPDLNEPNLIHLSAYEEPSEELESDEMEEIRIYTKIVKENVNYDHLIQRCKAGEQEDIDEILELIVETLCIKRRLIRVSGADYPHELVKNKLLKLNMQHIEYVLQSLSTTTTKIRNIKAYLLATLYNAPNTMNNYYRASVNHDLYGGSHHDT